MDVVLICRLKGLKVIDQLVSLLSNQPEEVNKLKCCVYVKAPFVCMCEVVYTCTAGAGECGGGTRRVCCKGQR